MKRYEQGSVGMRPDKEGPGCSWADVRKAVDRAVKAERKAWRLAVARGHLYRGACPDYAQPDARDERCPLCKLLGSSDGRR